MHYLQEPAPDYMRAAVTAAAELHGTGLPGDILIFLTGTRQPVLDATTTTLSVSFIFSWGALLSSRTNSACHLSCQGLTEITCSLRMCDYRLSFTQPKYVHRGHG